MVSLQFVREFVYEYCSKVTVSKGGQHFLTRCPLCGDSKKSLSKKRFNLDYNNGEPIFQCFNCGRTGSFVVLYADLKGISTDEANRQIYRYDPERIRRLMKASKHSPVKRIKPPEVTHDYIMNESIGMEDTPNGILENGYQKTLESFINDRNIQPPYSNHIRVAIKGRYKGRIIVPVIVGGHVLYFQGRRINKNIEPKYLNPVAEKSSIILNKEKFDPEKYIIITEGLLDAFSIGDQGTTCLGASITDDFIEELQTLTKKGVIIAVDNVYIDERGKKELLNIIEKSKYSNMLRYFIMPNIYKEIKDINELVVKNNINNVYEFILDNSHTKLRVVSLLKMEDKK
jgi:hypothetical protein